MEEKIKEYTVVTGEAPNELNRFVNALIVKGWRPQGGVSVIHRRSEESRMEQIIFAQALVK